MQPVVVVPEGIYPIYPVYSIGYPPTADTFGCTPNGGQLEPVIANTRVGGAGVCSKWVGRRFPLLGGG
jgi:hypothetical protein